MINFLVACGLIFVGFMFSRILVFTELNRCIKNRKQATKICLQLVEAYEKEMNDSTDDEKTVELEQKRRRNLIEAKECLEHYKALIIFKSKIDLL